jgi:hypothetical protein
MSIRMQVTVETKAAADRCALCHDVLGATGLRCPRCGTRAHGTCGRELGQDCPTLGCPGYLVGRRAPVEPTRAPEPTYTSRLHSFAVGLAVGVVSSLGAVLIFVIACTWLR